MMLALGFGCTEEAVELAEEQAFKAYVSSQFAEQPESYFTHEFIGGIERWVKERAKESRKIGGSYRDSSDFPERYSYFYCHITSSASDIVAVYKFHHINRRHALSPDGWALLTTQRLVHVDLMEIEEANHES